MRANYNAGHCAGERKPGSARTMGIKNNAKNNGNNENRATAPRTFAQPTRDTIFSLNIELDATVFGNAQNKPNMTDMRTMSLSALCFWPRRGPDEAELTGRLFCHRNNRQTRAGRRNHLLCGDLAGLRSKARPKRCCGRANVTLYLMPCTPRAGIASGIESIPAIQGEPIMADRHRPRRHKSVARNDDHWLAHMMRAIHR
jgi:hypothetical protein